MNFTLNQLRIFLTIAQQQSITKASEELHLTQPAVSIQLKNFQRQFDSPLTEIIGRNIYITDFGKEIALLAERIIEQANEISNKNLSFKGLLTGRLKISVVSTGKYIMPYFLAGFMKQHSGIQLELGVSNKDLVLKNLENNEVDFSLVSVLPNNQKLTKMDLLPNRLFLMGAGDAKSNLSISEVVQNEPVIYREKGSGTRQLMEKFLSQKNNSIQKKLELTSNEAVKQAIIAGLGYSIMPLIGVKNELINNEIKIIPIKGLPIQSTWSLVWNKNKEHSTVAKSFLQYLEQEKDNIIKRNFEWKEGY